MKKFFIVLLIAFIGNSFFRTFETKAQTPLNDSAEVHHDYLPNSYNFSLRAENYLSSGSYLFAEGMYKASESYFSTSEVFKEYFWLGYEQKASDKWYFGISGRILRYTQKFQGIKYHENSFIGRVNISHKGKIGSFGFLKELTFDQIIRKNNQNNARAGFAVGLYKKFTIGKFDFFPVISYKAYQIYDLKNPNSFFKNRRIDLTRLRFDLYFKPHPNFVFGLYAMREIDFYYVQAAVPEYKVNRIVPTFGCSVTFLLKPENNENLIPGLPLR